MLPVIVSWNAGSRLTPFLTLLLIITWPTGVDDVSFDGAEALCVK